MGVVCHADRGAVFPLYAKHHVVIICLLRSLVNFMVIGTATLTSFIFNFYFSLCNINYHNLRQREIKIKLVWKILTMEDFVKHSRINSSNIKTWHFGNDMSPLSNANNYYKIGNVIYGLHSSETVYLVISFFYLFIFSTSHFIQRLICFQTFISIYNITNLVIICIWWWWHAVAEKSCFMSLLLIEKF